jgi:uncharacterized protein (TIGR03437 family)
MRHFLSLAVLFSVVMVFATMASAQSFSLDQNSLQFFPNSGGSPQQQQVNLTNLTANSLNISLSESTQSGGNWLSTFIAPNPVPGNSTSTITVTVNPATLPAQSTFNGTVNVSGGGTSLTITVSVTPSGVNISVTSSVTANVVAGQQTSVSVQVIGGPVTVEISSSQSWLTAAASANVPGSFSVEVDASTLSIGQHSGSLTVQCAPGGSPCISQAVSVTAIVSQPITLNANITALTFKAYQGRGNPASQALQVTTSNGGSVGFTLSFNQSWLMASASSATASSSPTVVTVTVTTSGLSPGMNLGIVTVQPMDGGSPVQITVTAILSPFSITVSPNPGTQLMVTEGMIQTFPFQVASADGEPVMVAIAAQSNGNWLQTPASFNAPGQFNVTINAANLTPSNYSGMLTFSCTNATCAPVIVPVTITVLVGNVPQITPGGVSSASAFGGFSSITSGSYIEVHGSNLSTTTGEWGGSDFQGNQAPTMLEGVSATINDQSAFVYYISPAQVNLVVPDNIGTGSGQLVLTNSNGSTVPYSVEINAIQPGLWAPPVFLIGGIQYAGATTADGSTFILPTGAVPNITSRPAKPGETIILYGLGFGAVTPSVPAGTITPGANKLNGSLEILFGQTPATEISYAGLAPEFVGLYQFNVVVPTVANSDAVPVTFNLEGTVGSQTLYTAVQN